MAPKKKKIEAGTLARLFASNLIVQRERAGLSQEALAQAVGLSVGYVSMLERAQRSPTLDVIERFAEVLDLADPRRMFEGRIA